MKKIIIILSIILILSLAFISFNVIGLASAESAKNYPHSWTKAICNETYCQDYEMFCQGNKLINQTAITGAIIEISGGWTDPRNETNQKRVCE